MNASADRPYTFRVIIAVLIFLASFSTRARTRLRTKKGTFFTAASASGVQSIIRFPA